MCKIKRERERDKERERESIEKLKKGGGKESGRGDGISLYSSIYLVEFSLVLIRAPKL